MTLDIAKIIIALKNDYRFDGQVILITGASRGIGKALALQLAERGAILILLASSESILGDVYDEIVALGAPQPVLVPVDLNILKMSTAEELATYVEESFGRLDGLVHMAGILGGREPISTHRPEQWERTLQINLTAVFYLTQALLPLLDQSPAGRIIFATSSVGQRVEAYWGAYAVSKAGLEMFSGMLAKELENTSLTKVVTINPGGTATQMRREAMPGEDQNALPSAAIVARIFLIGLTSYAEHLHGSRLNAREIMSSLGTWPA